jgi:MFS family permease
MPNRSKNLRWYILALSALTIIFIGGAARFCILVLFREIATDLNLSLVQIGVIWGMDSLAGIFVSIPGGLILDRLGVRRSVVFICMIAAILGALRGFSNNFVSLALTTFVFGIVAATTITLSAKIPAIWFSGKYLGFINALLFVALAMGQMIGTRFSATVFSPFLHGWRNVLFLYAIPACVTGILWLAISKRMKQDDITATQQTTSEFISLLLHVVRIRKLWILGLVLFASLGVTLSVNSYLPLYLRGIGWSPKNADSALTLMIAMSCISTVPIALLSDKIRARKSSLILSIMIVSLSLASLSVLKNTAILFALIVNGLFRGVPIPILNTMVIETKGIAHGQVGTAVGLMYTVGMLGGFILPPAGNSFAVINASLPFVFWAVIGTLMLFSLCFVKETAGNQ